MSSARCPTCGKSFNSEDSRAMPFCSDRCRRIDLNRWLSEEISLPYRETADDDRASRPDDHESN